MAELQISERLQPSLLDRLTDSSPGDVKESRDERVIDMRRLREILQRDLAWLLNTTNHEGLFDAEAYPNVARSVLNYGLVEASGNYSTAERAALLRRSIEKAIRDFEPRLRAGSVDIEMRPSDSSSQSIVVFDIRADMWAQPMPMELYLRSEVDMTTGELSIERRG